MSLHTWWLYLCAVFLLSAVPGPNMLHVLSRSVTVGLRGSLPAMAGCQVGLLAALSASAAGLSAVLIASPVLFDIIRYAGVAYLLYLGIRAWIGGDAPVNPQQPGNERSAGKLSALSLFRGGFLVGISNPKLLLFATAFLPQFVDQQAAKAPQFVILVATFGATDLCWYAVYGLGGQTLATFLTQPKPRRLFDRVTGGLFIGFGAALLGSRG
ncbi:MAG: LysE family translocator [Dongiaceae bacterium]